MLFRFILLMLLAWLVMAFLPTEQEKATFAGGCFWCMEPQFKDIDGVKAVMVGYTGGRIPNPTYAQVSAGDSGHVEAIEVTYDPAQVTYEALLDIFWQNIDPFDAEGQFCDKGSQYRAAIFYHNEKQRALAEASKAQVAEKLGADVMTLIRPAQIFYAAEDYHQEFYIKNRKRYENYKKGCRREERLHEVWKERDVDAQ